MQNRMETLTYAAVLLRCATFLEAGINSGMSARRESKRLPRGVAGPILELQRAVQHNQTHACIHGEVFGTGDLKTTPDHPRKRTMTLEGQ